MPEYAYEALTAGGVVTRGAMPAASEADLEQRLRALDQYLVRAQAQAPGAAAAATLGAPAAALPKRTDGSLARQELLAFTDYLAGSVQAGIPILGTLEDVEPRMPSRRMRRIVAEVRAAMSIEGKALSEALAEHPRAFSAFYVGTIEAGEASGHLDFALRQLVDYIEWQHEIATQVRQATLYPAIVIVAVIGLVFVLITFVYPKLIPVLLSFDVELPLPTRMLMASATFLSQWWWALVAGVVAFATALWGVHQTERGRRAIDRWMLRLPLFGPLVQQINMARFVTYTALFYRSGVELIRGLILVERMIPNRVVSDGVRSAREAIVGGETLSKAFDQAAVFPPLVLRSIALGETTGKLDESLGRAKAYYDREVPAAVKRLLTGLQPLLVLLLGGIIAVVALSIFLPIVSIYQSIGNR